jgi:hypothetical protein
MLLRSRFEVIAMVQHGLLRRYRPRNLSGRRRNKKPRPDGGVWQISLDENAIARADLKLPDGELFRQFCTNS